MNLSIPTITLLLIGTMSAINAFTISSSSTPSPTLNISQMSTVEAPPREKTDRNIRDPTDDGTSYDDEDANTNDVVRYNDAPMEYLEDEFATRNPDDPFHILLLDSTFSQSGRVTESYVSGCLTYVLGTPDEDALELTKMAAFNGMSCLGTWEREECLSLGRKLQVRDLVIRVVPFCEGGGRSWQAKDASSQGGGAVPNDYSSNSFQ